MSGPQDQTEDRDDANTKECGKVHCARIVGEQDIAAGELVHQFGQGCLADEVVTLAIQGIPDFGAAIAVSLETE